MSIDIAGYKFDGPFQGTSSLEERSGVYAVLAKAGTQWSVLDVGESAEVKSRVVNHDRQGCWKQNANGSTAYAAHYTPSLQQAGRMAIEQKIRSAYRIPCGVR